MKKIFATLLAVSAISTGAYAAADDHGGNGQDNPAFFTTNTETNALSVVPSKDGEKADYLNSRQLR